MKVPMMPKDTTMTYEALVAFLKGTEQYVNVSIGAIQLWMEGANSVRSSPAHANIKSIAGMSLPELDALLKQSDSVLGVPTLYTVFMSTSALNAYLRGLVLAELKTPPEDDSWFSLDTVELVLGITLAEIPSYADVAVIYGARWSLLRLETPINWSIQFVNQIPSKVKAFAEELSNLLK